MSDNYGITIEVEQDDDSTNPAHDWDMVGTIAIDNRCRYAFGHVHIGCDEMHAILSDRNNIVLPVFMYDHSGISINTTGFSCPWDSGQVGIVYCSKEKAVEEFGNKRCTAMVRAAAIACMISDVKSVDDYLTGNVWGYRVLDADGVVLDSCWGFVGDEAYCREEAEATAAYHIKKAASEDSERSYWKERGVATI